MENHNLSSHIEQIVRFSPDNSVIFVMDPKRKVNLSLPKGGVFSYEGNLLGRELANIANTSYPEGTHLISKDLELISNGIYILKYTLNGEERTLKLGAN